MIDFIIGCFLVIFLGGFMLSMLVALALAVMFLVRLAKEEWHR